MKLPEPNLSRRDFLKLAGLGLGTLALNPFRRALPLADFPASDRLGRLDRYFGKVDIKSRPDENSTTVKPIYEDTVVIWLREVVGTKVGYISTNTTWVETPEGFVYAPFLQPVRNQPNTPLNAVPTGKQGFWVEVTVPYVDFRLENPAPISPWLKTAVTNNWPTRLYYSQIMWVDQIKTSEMTGNLIYRINERIGNPGDIFWAEGVAFRPLTEDEVSPIHPDVDPNEKKVVANLTSQTLSCFEGKKEVYFCRMSSGGKWDANGNQVNNWSTPLGEQITWRKSISTHMAGGTVSGGYDTPGVSWTTLFAGEGMAIHGTFWHNDFGNPRSHGCINVRPDDAKWIFRWTNPVVSLDPGDIIVSMPGGTHVIVIERYF